MRGPSVRAGALAALVACAASCSAIPEARTPSLIRREGNHLVGQLSPYLEAHAHNPIDWYPWSDEALARARREDKLVFLSIGYATCHYCHVMERESFRDEEVARTLNRSFIAIKVDREERPDVDALFVEAVTRLGITPGWPLNVILTPSLEPIFGGAYFSRDELLDVAREVSEKWRVDRADITARGRSLLARMEADARARGAGGELSEKALVEAFSRLDRARDTIDGGYGVGAKFPSAPLLLAELRWSQRARDASAANHLGLTLERAARGGIYDRLSGSFHRYAVDRRWRTPHFEKTIYDNAGLALAYTEAAMALRDSRAAWLAQVGRGITRDLIARWQRADGGFVTAFDADDERGEGAYYSFTSADLSALLGAGDARVAVKLFDLGATPRALARRHESDVARETSATRTEIRAVEARAMPVLAAARAKRPTPRVDDKELAGMAGLALYALASARVLTGDEALDAPARAAGDFLMTCWDPTRRVMLRGKRRGAPIGEGFLEDYALAALGLLRLHAIDHDLGRLRAARAIAHAMIDRFYDPSAHTFMNAARSREAIPLRRPDVDDTVMPSGGSAAALALLQLGALLGDDTLEQRGREALRAAVPRAVREPVASGFLLVALDHAISDVREVVIAGAPDDARTKALARAIEGTTDARVLVAHVPREGAPREVEREMPALQGKRSPSGRPAAFVCRRGACEAPTFDAEELKQRLLSAER